MQWPIPQFPTKAVVGSAQTLTMSGTANTKGPYTTLLTGTTAAAAWINLSLGLFPSTTADRSILFDLAIGGSGSETIVAPDLLLGFQAPRSVLIPLHLPAGATLRGRYACSDTSFLFPVRATAYCGEPDSGLSVPSRIAAYGVASASSGGTTVTPPGSSNTKGSWAQLTATTTAPIHALMVMAQSSSTTILTFDYLIDIGVGGSGSETVIVPNVVVSQADPYVYPASPTLVPLSMCIPAGVRLSARCSIPSSSTWPIEVAVYGVTY